jgi:hypothetical protein
MNMTTNEYGTKIAGALKAVAQMHSDTSRLLVDCDKYIGKGRPSLFGSYATRDLTYNYKAAFWMAEGVYRFYPAGPDGVDGVTIAFHYTGTPSDPRSQSEPLLLVGHIRYSPSGNALEASNSKAKCEEWDLWNLYFEWGKDREVDKVLTYEVADGGRIVKAELIAMPLFAVNSIGVVEDLTKRVAAAPMV